MHQSFPAGKAEATEKNVSENSRQPATNHTDEKNTPEPDKPKEVWLDKQEVLQRMHISNRTLQTWRTHKLLRYSKIRGKIYYRESDLQMLLEKNMK